MKKIFSIITIAASIAFSSGASAGYAEDNNLAIVPYKSAPVITEEEAKPTPSRWASMAQKAASFIPSSIDVNPISVIAKVVGTIVTQINLDKIMNASQNVQNNVNGELQDLEDQGVALTKAHKVAINAKYGFAESFKFTWSIASVVAQKHGIEISAVFILFLVAALI